MNDDLFPDRSPVSVREVVDLVHDHVAEGVECPRVGVEHVAEHFSGHDHHGSLAVDGGIAGQQTHVRRPIAPCEVAVFLVAERLDGGRVERLHARAQREVGGKLPHDCLAGAGWCGNKNRMSVLKRRARLQLEVVEFELELLAEVGQRGRQVGGASLVLCVLFGGA